MSRNGRRLDPDIFNPLVVKIWWLVVCNYNSVHTATPTIFGKIIAPFFKVKTWWSKTHTVLLFEFDKQRLSK